MSALSEQFKDVDFIFATQEMFDSFDAETQLYLEENLAWCRIPSPVPAVTENSSQEFKDYKQYLEAIFKPGDTLCFVSISHGTKVVTNDFVDRDRALTPGCFEIFKQANRRASIYVGMNAYSPELRGSRMLGTRRGSGFGLHGIKHFPLDPGHIA